MMRRTHQNLSALFGSIGRPGISTLASWGCAALAYQLASRGGYAGAVGAALIVSLSVLYLAYVLGSGALAFTTDARGSCLPGSQRLARRAYLLAAVLLLPALVLSIAAFAGNPMWPAWVPTVLVLAIVLAGVLAARRPAAAAGLFLLVVLAASWAARGPSIPVRGMDFRSALLATAFVLIPAALALVPAVEWRRLIRYQPWAAGHTPRLTSSRRGSWERQSPVRVVRTCLGGMFVQFPRQLLLGTVLLCLFAAAAVGRLWFGAIGNHWTVITLALAAGSLISSGFLGRLPKLTHGQIAELALLPGLGAPSAQRQALCRAVLTPPLWWLGVVLLFGSAALLLRAEPPSNVGMLAVGLFVVWLTYTIFALQKLATQPPKHQSFIADMMVFWLTLYGSGSYYWAYAEHSQFRHWFWFWIVPVLWSIGIASGIGLSLRRFATAPHPFLSQA